MSDNLRRYRAIHKALTQWYPGESKGNLARHLTTLEIWALNFLALALSAAWNTLDVQSTTNCIGSYVAKIADDRCPPFA